ncbi:hypothetical protein NFB56_15065 [Yersinia ruckeri]|uniref:hypothetical protein n=1 Tax=Yersinia ruckeri TaxID=29486 RepID=UPI0022376CAF|nr:hypothetical protein [Yersinia ruckeri]MCW6550165.1 hypothetical protein [Yersinia ruckeri]
MKSKISPIIFTPDNEPYLGRELLNCLDIQIISALKQSSDISSNYNDSTLDNYQCMANQVISQSISLVLSIRELIRQGYLFGGHVLNRSLIERVTILLYLHLHPEHIEKWDQGWVGGRGGGKAPSLGFMFTAIQKKLDRQPVVPGHELTNILNSLVHGKPDSAPWNLVSLGGNKAVHAVSKILQRPELCDELCVNVIPQLCIISSMMTAYFPNSRPNHESAI